MSVTETSYQPRPAANGFNRPTDGLAARGARERAEAADPLEGFRLLSPRRSLLGDTLTLTTAGTLGIGDEAYRLLGSPAKVQVFYHDATRMAALRPAAAGARDAITVNPNGRGFALSARSLVAAASLPKQLFRFKPERRGDVLLFGPLPEVSA